MEMPPTGRKIGNRYLFSSGRMMTDKSDKPLEYESGLEKDILSLLIFDNAVKSIKTQPFTIKWFDGEKWRKYTPDIQVNFIHPDDTEKKNRIFVFEVKPSLQLKEDWMNLKLKFKEARKWCKNRSVNFRIITDKIAKETYIKNINFLMHQSESVKYLDKSTYNKLRDYILSNKKSSCTTLEQLLEGESEHHHRNNITLVVWTMIRLGEIEVNLNESLSNRSLLFIREHIGDFNCNQSPMRTRFHGGF